MVTTRRPAFITTASSSNKVVARATLSRNESELTGTMSLSELSEFSTSDFVETTTAAPVHRRVHIDRTAHIRRARYNANPIIKARRNMKARLVRIKHRRNQRPADVPELQDMLQKLLTQVGNYVAGDLAEYLRPNIDTEAKIL